MQKSTIRTLCALLLGTLPFAAMSTAGCTPSMAAEPVERAPYELLQDGTTLRIRDDLAPLLVSSPVQPSSDGAELEGFGHVGFAPGASYAVRSSFDGYVEQVHVQVGDTVKAGAVLATLRSSEVARMRAEARSLAATLETERDALARVERLFAENAASAREVVETRGRIGVLEAELSGIRGALSAQKTGTGGGDSLQLRADKAGDVLARRIEPGERVQVGDSDPAFLIGNSSSLVVMASFPERDASLLAHGARCDFSVPSIGGVRFSGQVSSVVQAIDRETRTARVVCTPSSPDRRFRAEMIARVFVEASESETIVVPRSAVLLRRDDRVVFVRRSNNELERRVVVTGLSLGGGIQILSGLNAGEEVVTEGAVLIDGELDKLLS